MTRSPTPSMVVVFFRRFGLPLTVFVVIFLLTLDNYRSTIREEEDAARNRFQTTAREQIAQLRDRTDSLVRQADILRRQMAFAPAETRAHFAEIVAPVLQRHPEILRLGLLRVENGNARPVISAGNPQGSPLPTPADIVVI